jgi:hypothetical protein
VSIGVLGFQEISGVLSGFSVWIGKGSLYRRVDEKSMVGRPDEYCRILESTNEWLVLEA